MLLINPAGSRGGGSKSFQRQEIQLSEVVFTQEAPPLVWLSAQPVNAPLWFHKCDNKLSGINHSCFVAVWQSHFMPKIIAVEKYL